MPAFIFSLDLILAEPFAGSRLTAVFPPTLQKEIALIPAYIGWGPNH